MKERKKAARKLYKRIGRLAETAEPEEIVKLAEAYAKVTFGAQGHTIYDQIIRREEPVEKGTGFK